ncbi:hypothetical protein RIF29_38762 [Crotalaria pallida]|uniref:Uncharacterized protein n=1 Tax=Crotalaria pallida TaxID=3830 RepID=A0AAN9HQ16_CROPI
MASLQKNFRNDWDCKRKSKLPCSSTMDTASSSMNTTTSFSHGYEGIPPYCACGGARAILRTARTEEHYGCNFFDWYKEDIVREKELIILKQRLEIESIQKDLDFSRKWMKILLVICIVLFFSCPVGSTIEGDLLSPWSFERSCHSVRVASFFGSGDKLGADLAGAGAALLAGAGANWLTGAWADLAGALFFFLFGATEVWVGTEVWLAEVCVGTEIGPAEVWVGEGVGVAEVWAWA